jgi:F-type H+-transporting ATPase subunit gamma
MQITSAMKMVSAEKQETECNYSNAPLCRKVNLNYYKIFLQHEGDAGGEFTTREVKKVLVVAITSNRGLCGAVVI